MKRFIFALALILANTFILSAQNDNDVAPHYGKMPPIHVDGNQLRDEAGNKVVLHGVMDTPSPYFNSWRWGNSATDANISACVNYFDKLFTAITDSTSGAYCNLFRLHLDPCWTNDNSVNAKGFTTQNGKTYDPLGQEVGGEADIHHYSGARLTRYLKTVYWRIAQQGLRHGLYIIMRPPGVCPGDIKVGTYYQDYLVDVWDRVTKNDSIKKYYGQIGLELANEPVRIKDANGSESNDQRYRDFFQPVIDKIRANGFKGIIWLPGGIWQQEYKPYAACPPTDPLNNLGYAVHNYPGWYNNSDQNCVAANTIAAFGNSVPVVRTNPIVITEVDWSPQKPGTGHYNESGAWVESNYGTWATASTSKWGKAYKALLDNYGNISMTLSGTACYIDVDSYIKSKKVVPAFPGVTEACGEACFKWYAEYAKVDYPSDEYYQEMDIPENAFELSDKWFNPHILYEGTATHSSSFSTVNMKKGGCVGWRFDNPGGLDISQYEYLKIVLPRNAVKGTYLRIYDNSCNANYFGDCYKLNMAGSKEFTIDLQNLVSEAGNKIDLSHIRIVGVSSDNADQKFYISSITLDGNASGITDFTAGASAFGKEEYFTTNGIRINSLQKGLNIVKKADGSVKKVLVK